MRAALLLLASIPAFAQTKSAVVVPEIQVGSFQVSPSPALSGQPLSTTLTSPLSPSALNAGLPTPSFVPLESSPSMPSAFKAAVPAASKTSVMIAPKALSAIVPAASKPAVDESKKSAESAKSESSGMFDGALKVLVAGSEAVPFIKTGGLADVVDAVSRGLAERGHEVTLVLPKYKQLKTSGMHLTKSGKVTVEIGGRKETAEMLVGHRDGVRVVLLEHPEFYEREGGPYASKSKPTQIAYSAYDAGGMDDADERFGFYARAALEAARRLGFKPDVVHAHDWHAALIPSLLKGPMKGDAFFAGTKTALTIHNIAFQGAFALTTAAKFGFDDAVLEHMGGANYLKAGIRDADAVTTVSPTYAKEIVENKAFSAGLESTLRGRDEVVGILNGIDPRLYDPETDPELVANYGIDDAAEGKAKNKAELQSRLDLDRKPDAPLFVVASRLADQKGIDMVYETAKDIVALGGQLAIMGSGDPKTEAMREALVAMFPGKVASHPFDETAVRLLFAAADFLLMPSRFEPCGLSQLIAQRYGTLPIVTPVGGLADTVVDLRDDPVNGTGLFAKAVAGVSLSRAIAAAAQGYRHPRAFEVARRSAMRKDSSWEIPLDSYEALFRRLLRSEGPEKP